MKVMDIPVRGTGNFEMALLRVEQRATKNGKAFVVVTCKPEGEQAIQAKVWDTERDAFLLGTPENSVIRADVTADEYDGQRTYVLTHVRPADDSSDLTRFADEGVDGASRLRYMDSVIRSTVPNQSAAYRVYRLLFNEHEAEWASWPAAQSIHHAYPGGLAEHSLRTFFNVLQIARLYEKNPRLFACRQDPATSYRSVIAALGAADQTRPCIQAALAVFRMFDPAVRNEADNAAGNAPWERQALQLALAHELTRSYGRSYVDPDLLAAGAALRGVSAFLDPEMAKMVGIPAADVLLARSKADNADCEDMLLLEHVLLCREEHGNFVHAAIPEAFMATVVDDMALSLYAAANVNAPLETTTLLTAAALHDIGKLAEMQPHLCGPAEYTVKGNLSGHILLGIEMAAEAADRLGIPRTDIQPLLSDIASHHGRLDYGALVMPMSPEASLLAYADLLDSRMDMHRQERTQMDGGAMSSRLRPFLHAVLYKPENVGIPAVQDSSTASGSHVS